MITSTLIFLSLVLTLLFEVEAFSIVQMSALCNPRVTTQPHLSSTISSQLSARGSQFDGIDDDDDVDDRDLVPVGRRSGRRRREEGGYYDDRQATTFSSSSSRYQENVDFFDLDDDADDDLFEDEFDEKQGRGIYEETYNGIIPNPLLDAMDPDGVYERLGPELFRDWTFFRDMALFAAFLAFFTGDTHRLGTFDSVVEGLERLPVDFIK